jgi:hypothetical protein
MEMLNLLQIPNSNHLEVKNHLQFLIQNHPQVEKPFGPLQENAAATQVATNKNNTNFGLQQMAFIGQFGTMTPITHTPQLLPPNMIIGQRVVMLNLENGNVTDFISLKNDPSFRPMGIKFNEKEGALYIISAGKLEVRDTFPNGKPLPMPMLWGYAHTGVVWKVMKTNLTGQ